MPTAAPRTLHVVLPGGIDDPAQPSGGNTYDRIAIEHLRARGTTVREHVVEGAWPHPTRDDERRLAAALATVGDGGPVLLDGLVGCAAPRVVVPAADRVRTMVLVHLPLADETGLDPAVATALDKGERRVLRSAAAVVTPSAALAARVVARHGLDAARVHVAAPGVRTAAVVEGSASGHRLTCLASLTPRKGHDVLLDALSRLPDRDWTLTCAGPGSPGNLLRRSLFADVDLAVRVSFPGPLVGAALDALWQRTDLLVLPSLCEPFGMVVTEALARGIPVVATDVDGLPEALGRAGTGRPDGPDNRPDDRPDDDSDDDSDDGIPGALVPPGDADALAAALALWWDDPDTRAAWRRNALRRRTTLPGWDATARALEGVLG